MLTPEKSQSWFAPVLEIIEGIEDKSKLVSVLGEFTEYAMSLATMVTGVGSATSSSSHEVKVNKAKLRLKLDS